MTEPRVYNADQQAQRANPPGLYTCPHCGETLSGPARLYLCPQASQWERAIWRKAA